jgi:beta-glucosidase/6-phospho-beta-glucosidase/beta-galactosidase
MMVFEAATEWYQRYQHFIEMFEEMGVPMDTDMDDPGPDEI